MESKPLSQAARTRFLLTSLVFIIVFVLTLCVLVLAYPVLLAPLPTITPTITLTRTTTPTTTNTPTFTLSPTTTRTPRPTLTPSITPTYTPTSLPTFTPTPTGPPTLTPAVPFGGEANYNLNEWTPERAAELVALLQYYPRTLPLSVNGEENSQISLAYAYPIFAQDEALLRFPDSEQAQDWAWNKAYNLALMDDPAAASEFSKVIALDLNRGLTDLEQLDSRVQSLLPGMSVVLFQLDPPQGSTTAYLVQIKGQGSCFVLAIQKPGGFQVFPLASRFDNPLPILPQVTTTPTPTVVPIPNDDFIVADLTGDGNKEIIIYRTNPSTYKQLDLPQVFSIASLPPQEIPFDPISSPFTIGMSYLSQWKIDQDNQGNPQLSFSTRIFPACPVEIKRSYQVDDELFQPVDTQYSVIPFQETLSYCKYMVDHASAAWGPEASISVINTLLPNWPPEYDANNKPSTPDAADELRFLLGLEYAMNGEVDKARLVLQDLRDKPAFSASRWISPADQFLAFYKTQTDIYRTCLVFQTCNPSDALAFLLKIMPEQNPGKVIPYLEKQGVTFRSSGYFDFDGDDVRDVWFTIQHRPGELIDLWVLLSQGDRIASLNIDPVANSIPELSYYDEEQEPPVILMNNRKAFQVLRVSSSRAPYLVNFDLPKYYPNKFKEAVEQTLSELLSGDDPAALYMKLKSMQKTPGLLCKADWSCDKYYYLLGLTAELSGKNIDSVSAYYRLWWDYSKSPFTTMARLKLKQLFIPTPPPTPTIPPTATLIPRTGTATQKLGTPATPTRTSTPNPNFTSTSAPLPTQTSGANTTPNPYPNPYP